MDTTTKLRLLLANVVAGAGSIRDVATTEVQNANDVSYLLTEVDRLQSVAHRMIAFLDDDMLGLQRH